MSVDYGVYIGPVLIIRPPATLGTKQVSKCTVCLMAYASAFCPTCGARTALTEEPVPVRPRQWWNDFDGDDNWGVVVDVESPSIPDEEIWLKPTMNRSSMYINYDVKQDEGRIEYWVINDLVNYDPAKMMEAFSSDPVVQPLWNKLRASEAEIRVAFVSLVEVT